MELRGIFNVRLLLNEARDTPFLFRNFSSLNISNQQVKFDRKTYCQFYFYWITLSILSESTLRSTRKLSASTAVPVLVSWALKYLFRDANSFPRASLSENCELRGTDDVQGQIYEHIFAPNGDYCVIILQIFFNKAVQFWRPFLKVI